MTPMVISATGKSRTRFCRKGFTLVELLAVVVIMAIVFGLLAVSITQTRGPAVLVGAGQVASGLGLARQIAISKNTQTRFIIAHTNGPGLPQEPFRYWSIISSNRDTGTWLMEKEWERLPQGIVFLNIAGRDYNTINWDPIPAEQLGKPFEPLFAAGSANQEWKHFTSFTTTPTRITYAGEAAGGGTSDSFPQNMPYLGFKPTGAATIGPGGVGSFRLAAVRLAEGSVRDSSLIIESTDNAAYVETDALIGKIIVRPRTSYR